MDKLQMRWPDLVEPVKEFKNEVHEFFKPHPHVVHHHEAPKHTSHHKTQMNWDFLFPFNMHNVKKTTTHHEKVHHSPFEFLMPIHHQFRQRVQSIQNLHLF